jgi:hypothetical protein
MQNVEPWTGLCRTTAARDMYAAQLVATLLTSIDGVG